LDSVIVIYQKSKVPLKKLAQVEVKDVHTLIVAPFDDEVGKFKNF